MVFNLDFTLESPGQFLKLKNLSLTLRGQIQLVWVGSTGVLFFSFSFFLLKEQLVYRKEDLVVGTC